MSFDHGDRLPASPDMAGMCDSDLGCRATFENSHHPNPNPLSGYRERGPEKRSRSGRGFTLIEITMVVVILAILAAIALPSLATQSDLTTDAASRVVIGDLLYAQSQAIATGQNQFVTFNLGGSGSYEVSSVDPLTQANGYVRTCGVGFGPLADVAIADLNLDSSANSVLVFGGMGQPYVCPVNGTPVALANTGTIVLQCGSSKVTLSVEPATGNITVSP